jgi:hypothetical protein
VSAVPIFAVFRRGVIARLADVFRDVVWSVCDSMARLMSRAPSKPIHDLRHQAEAITTPAALIAWSVPTCRVHRHLVAKLLIAKPLAARNANGASAH